MPIKSKLFLSIQWDFGFLFRDIFSFHSVTFSIFIPWDFWFWDQLHLFMRFELTDFLLTAVPSKPCMNTIQDEEPPPFFLTAVSSPHKYWSNNVEYYPSTEPTFSSEPGSASDILAVPSGSEYSKQGVME